MKPKKHSVHGEKDSPFYKLSTKRKLAELLFTSVSKLQELKKDPSLYSSFLKKKKNGGARTIHAPRPDLKIIQRRIADLLQRIAPPDYLFAPVPGRSYVDNAQRHIGNSAYRLLDIENFFPSCTADRVIWLFRTRLECPIDVAVVLRALVTHNGVLPQGSPCSPILAYLCYVDMWEAIESLALRYKCTISVYADDITLSGKVVPAALAFSIKRLLRKYGHKHAAHKERSHTHRAVKVTGAIVDGHKLALPNQQHKKLHELRTQLRSSKSAKIRKSLAAQLRGRQSQLGQIHSRNTEDK